MITEIAQYASCNDEPEPSGRMDKWIRSGAYFVWLLAVLAAR
jgi:hypothetical protein